jgi:hypothetical protein
MRSSYSHGCRGIEAALYSCLDGLPDAAKKYESHTNPSAPIQVFNQFLLGTYSQPRGVIFLELHKSDVPLLHNQAMIVREDK